LWTPALLATVSVERVEECPDSNAHPKPEQIPQPLDLTLLREALEEPTRASARSDGPSRPLDGFRDLLSFN